MFPLFVLFPLLFCDEIPLDAIKSLPKSSLKLHNYKNKKSQSSLSALLESGLPGVAWELLRGAPAQTESEALLSCKAQLIRMTKSLNEGPYVKAIMEQGSCAGAVMEALVQLRSSPLRTAEAWVETARLESWPPPSGRWGAPNTVWLLCWQDGHRAEGFHNGLSLTPVRCAEVGRYSNIWLCISLRFLDFGL